MQKYAPCVKNLWHYQKTKNTKIINKLKTLKSLK